MGRSGQPRKGIGNCRAHCCSTRACGSGLFAFRVQGGSSDSFRRPIWNRREFVIASKEGKTEAVLALLGSEHACRILAEGEEGLGSALCIAASWGHAKIVSLI